MTANSPTGTVREIWPLLFVQDIVRSLEFYRDRLGFDVVQEAQDNGRVFWCRLKRDEGSLMLQQAEEEDKPGRPGQGVVLFFLCDDANAIHSDLVARGLDLPEPQTAYYGMRQVSVRDPDGYDLCFESVVDTPTG